MNAVFAAVTHVFLLALAWCKVHPAEVTMAVGAIVSLFAGQLQKYPRGKAFLDLLAHAGVNVPGVVNAIVRLITGKPAVVAAATMCLLMLGCTPAAGPVNASRAEVRAVAETAESAWMLAAHGCRDAAVMAESQNLLKQCAAILEPARDSILAADAMIDAWPTLPDAGPPGNVVCLLSEALLGMTKSTQLPGVLTASEATLVPLLADLAELTKKLPGASCAAVDGGSNG